MLTFAVRLELPMPLTVQGRKSTLLVSEVTGLLALPLGSGGVGSSHGPILGGGRSWGQEGGV